MNKLLRLLLIYMCCCAAVAPAWAQGSKEVIAVGQTARDVATGAGAVSHIPQITATTGAITQQVTKTVEAAQQAAQGTSTLPRGGVSTGISSQQAGSTGVRNSTTSSSSQAPDVPPPSTVTKAELPNIPTSGNKLTGWADHLITSETMSETATMLRSLERRLNVIRASRAQFTEEQLARIDEAERYFLNLTPQQANDLHTISSGTFRTHAMLIRSPAATEYGYFFTGHSFLHESESIMYHINEYGYIPVYRGDPVNGLAKWDMQQMISSPIKTDRPIFVLLDIHGGINSLNNFHAGPNTTLRISTNDIVRAMQELRQATGTPEINLFVDSCCTGALLEEFESLPLPQRQGINVFVPTGAGQCTYIAATAHYRTHTPGQNISKELVEKMIEQIINGHIMPQANIAGKNFNPLKLAIQKANESGDYRLADLLGRTFNLQQTKRHSPGSSLSKDESLRYFIARVAYEEGTARYGTLFEGSDRFTNAMQKLKDAWATHYNIPPEDWFLEERFFDGRFNNKPLK